MEIDQTKKHDERWWDAILVPLLIAIVDDVVCFAA